MTSDPVGVRPAERTDSLVYVWVWLPGATEPVVAGVLQATGELVRSEPVLVFRYAASYRSRSEAIALHPAELPLTGQTLDPRHVPGRDPLPLAGVLRDAAPDAWGRRVVNARLGAAERDLSEQTYLLCSGSDRIGALDFQADPGRYVARDDTATLAELIELVELVESGAYVPDTLTAAALHGTSIGGARPKALLRDGDRRLIAKFSSSTDTRPVVQAETVAMLLAAPAGLDVPAVHLVHAAGRDVMLVERFDRNQAANGFTRRQMISMLTVLGLWEMNSRYASYADLADSIRTGPWSDVRATLHELYARLVFNVYVGNNDDHLRNHSAFWDGRQLTLTPAYDLAPQPRGTRTSTQAIAVTRDGRRSSQLWLCREAAADFQLSPHEADAIIERVGTAITEHWDDACDEARLTGRERQTLWGREFCNPYIFDGSP